MSPAAAAWVPLPLVVSAAADGTLVVPDATRAFLRTLTAPTVRVLGVFGPPHTGKRLLLATLLHADAGAFSTQPSDTAEHVLVWLWHAPNAANSDDARLVLSANTAAENEQHARRARALLLLLSSTLLYNDDGEIDAAALERLAWVREIASSLRIKPNQDDDGVAADIHQHAPAFVWVQQNAKIKWLTDADTGDKMTATQYLNKCLAEEAGFSDAVAARNEQRMYFHSIFKKCACVALSRAVEGGAAASFSLPRDQLRGQFIEAIETQLFTPFLSARSGYQLPTKTVLGREIRGDQFGHVVDAYVSAWNANAVPAIQTAANALLQHDVEDAFQQARHSYEQELKTIVPDEEEDATVQPTDARALSLAHWRGLERAIICLQPLQAQLPETTKRTLFQNGLATLKSEFAARLDTLQTRNAALSASLCERLLKELLPANLEMIAQALESRPRDAFSDGLLGLLTQYKSDLRDAVDAYKTQGAGPALYASLVNALLASVFDSIKTYGASVLRQYQQHMRAFQEQRAGLDQELALAQQQDTSAAFSADDQKKLYEEQLEQSTQQLSELRRALQGELNAKKNELDRLMGDMTTMDAKHEVRVRTMTSDLAWVRSRTEELERQAMADRQRLEETMTGATDEMLAKERTHHKEERTLFAQQKELLARVVELERELVQKKTRHVQQVFAIESDHAKRVDELKQEQAEFARQLRSQAKTDTGVLKLAYTKKKAVVQADMDRVAREIQELEDKLQAYESQNAARVAKSPTGTKTPVETTATTTTAPKLESAFAVVSALRTSSREFLFKSPDAESPPAVGATRGTRSDTEMCKAQ